MNIHFIAIGGSAMHNLAIALHTKGAKVTGSDDEIFEPSRSRLKNKGILPESIGWDTTKITKDLDAVILGMHAREDNPELLRAKELGLPVYSYPEYLYEQSKHKKRIVIGGSHGKTSITSMLLHVTQALNVNVDYMVGAQLEGYDCMVKLSDTAKYMILEGDEYLSSPIDRRPKFHLYQPNVALLSGIAWDHINVFKTFEEYVRQFEVFGDLITDTLVYNEEDEEVRKIGERLSNTIQTTAYKTPEYEVTEFGTKLFWEGEAYELAIFGQHNLQNLIGAMYLATHIEIEPTQFFKAMQTFTGAGKRLQKVVENPDFVMYKDFAHSPSKLKATTSAVKEQYPERKLVACMELHTFSSLNKDFLPLYKNAMDAADIAIVYFNPKVVAHKKLPPLAIEEVQQNFGEKVLVETETTELKRYLDSQDWKNSVLLMMSSGNFDGIDFDELGAEIIS